jgi:hypothetical protein
LYGAGLHTRLKIKYRPAATRHEHVEHFIETLDDQELGGQLTLVRLSEAEVLEVVLRSRQHAKSHQKKSLHESHKSRQKTPTVSAPAVTTRVVHVVRPSRNDTDTESERAGSDAKGDLHKVYLPAVNDGSSIIPTDRVATLYHS